MLIIVMKNNNDLITTKKNSFFKKSLKLSSKLVTTKEGLGTVGGATAGGWVGSSIGIAAMGTAVAGTLPVAIAGGIIGYLGVKAIKNKKNN
tara:strand:+ start:117 stop:389 length:273 start_codon:yes stop_codon:yes gene_type:complete